MNNRLILVGCGAFARELICWIEDAVDLGYGRTVTGFLDEDPKALEKFSYPYKPKWISTIDDYIVEEGDELIMAISDPHAKSEIVQKLQNKGANFVSFIHPSALIARSAILGEGVIVCPRVRISADAKVGNFVTLNGLSGVGHDVVIEQYTTVSSYVDLTGWVRIEQYVFLGTGARILPRVRIGANSKIGAGATVVRSVAENSIMYTYPAKKL
jgi:sugar O-acyltransferase (sialic acid O-acetyltransferase NeuD family)